MSLSSTDNVIKVRAAEGQSVTRAEVDTVFEQLAGRTDLNGKRVLLIIPDGTRTAPIGMLFKSFFERFSQDASKIDVLIALGTHPPMSEEAINERLELTAEERSGTYGKVGVYNHAWCNPEVLQEIGRIPAKEIDELSGGLFSMEVPVQINKMIDDYDTLMILGPVFPHEVVGFSGGNKYFFPGIGGPDILNFFHWLGAVVTNPMIIGNKWTPVRKVVDRAAALIKQEKIACCAVVDGPHFAGLYVGSPEAAWDESSELSAELHITYKDRAYDMILSCAPQMYDEVWVAGKCMYKLEPVLADRGKLIIYAPHLNEISETHGKLIREIGYHCRDYFLKQWDKFKDFPWGILAHSTHVKGIGSYEDGVETPRAEVILATQLDEATCNEINLGYMDVNSINPEDYTNREDEGILYVPKAGERLFHQKEKPQWAGG